MLLNLKNVILFYVGILFCGLLTFTPYTYYWSDNLNSVCLFAAGSLGIIIFLPFILFAVHKPKISVIDLILLVLMNIILISSLRARYVVGNEQLYSLMLIGFIYLAIRLLNLGPGRFAFIFGVFFIIEIIVSTFQYIQHYQQAGSFDLITATVGNSNLFACFIVAVTWFMLQPINSIANVKIRIWAMIGIFLLILFVLFISRSKGATVCFLGSLVFFYDPTNLLSFFKHKLSLTKIWILKAVILIFTIIVAYTISYNVPSSIGRRLIWKVTSAQINTNIFWGIGYGKFPTEYLSWQSHFFQANGAQMVFKNVADVNYEVFNEPLQVLIELGATGFIVFLILIYAVCKLKTVSSHEWDMRTMKTSLLAIIIFSLFSYPFHSTAILLLTAIILALCVNLATLDNDHTVYFLNRKKMILLVFCFCTYLAVISCFYVTLIPNLKWLFITDQIADNDKDLRQFSVLYPNLRSNGLFLFDYGDKLFSAGAYDESSRILEQSCILYTNERTYDMLGLSYQKLKQYQKAENNFLFLSNMLPGRFRPRYLLAKLYLEKGDTAKAQQIAVSILKMPIKIPSQEIDDIRFEMQSIAKNGKD